MNQNNLKDLLIQKTVFLSIKGQLNPFNALAFKKNIFNISDEKTYLVLDLTNLNSISGDGIKVFYESIKYFQKRNGIIILINPKEEIFLLIKFLKLLNYVIIVKNHQEAKEIIENHINQQVLVRDFQIEETQELFQGDETSKKDLHEDKIIKHNMQYYEEIYNKKITPQQDSSEELKSLKEKLNDANQRLAKIGEKLQNVDISTYKFDESLYDFISKKIEEIKQSNESYFKEFQLRFDSIEESHNDLKNNFYSLKKEVEALKITIQTQKSNQDIIQNAFESPKEGKKINGYIIFSCSNCGQPLRVKQYGKHLCPNCNTEFNVLPTGEIKFFEHS